jgi:hypothetical protein
LKFGIKNESKFEFCPCCQQLSNKSSFIGYAKALLYSCENCGTQFHEIQETETSLSFYYESKYAHYLKQESVDERYKFHSKTQSLIKEIRNVLSEHDDEYVFVEFGSSFPLLSVSLLQEGLINSAIAIEPNSEARDWGEQRGVKTFSTLADFTVNFVHPQKYLIVANHVLEHLIKPGEVLEIFSRISKAGSILIGAVPNGNSVFFQKLRDEWEWFGYPDHLTYFSPFGLELLLGHSGWRTNLVASRNEDDEQTLNLVKLYFPDLDRGSTAIENLMLGKEIYFMASRI